MESIQDVTSAAAATNAAPSVGTTDAGAKHVPLTFLHTQDARTEWVNGTTGQAAGVAKPARAGVKALYGQPTEPFSVATSPTHLYPVVNTGAGDGQPAGSFDIATGNYKTTGRESFVSLAVDAFGNPDGASRIVAINEALASHPVAVPFAPNTLVRLYFEQ